MKGEHIMGKVISLRRRELVWEEYHREWTEKDFDEYLILLAKPMEGTLSERLLNISLKVRAKTGTASNISSIAGYIDTKNNKKYSFAIMIQNHNTDVYKVKKLEDEIINEIYKM